MSSNVMHVAKTGLNAQQARIQVISNNLANVNTTGFTFLLADFTRRSIWPFFIHTPVNSMETSFFWRFIF